MAVALEEQKMQTENSMPSTTLLTAYNRIPYSLMNAEIEGNASDVLREFGEIVGCYKAYEKGIEFLVEGTQGDYVAANLRYKKVATLINKEARFLFGEKPDINIKADGDVGKITEEAKNNLTTMQNMVDKILKSNKFEEQLVKAAKDCFIGKRVAVVVNFNEENGVTVTFLPAFNFIYETKPDNRSVLTKFVCFEIIKESSNLEAKRIFKKKYTLEVQSAGDDQDGVGGEPNVDTSMPVCFIEEQMYDGRGALLETITEKQPTLLNTIPAVVVLNDGLIGDIYGDSEVELLQDYEMWYSKLSNGDMDAQRKGMNPIKYTVDLDNNSTKNLSTSAGSFWDLMSDQNLDNPNPLVGILESTMSYSSSLETTLSRIEASMYEQVDIPNITLEGMQGVITSGKALKAIYWPLIVRCKEKMKTWGPALEFMARIIIEGALAYPNCIEKYTSDFIYPVDYDIDVVPNYPLPEDEQEEKAIDLSEVAAQTMSRKAYMKKWRLLSDDEADAELEQIALEQAMFDTMGGIPGLAVEMQEEDEQELDIQSIEGEEFDGEDIGQW